MTHPTDREDNRETGGDKNRSLTKRAAIRQQYIYFERNAIFGQLT